MLESLGMVDTADLIVLGVAAAVVGAVLGIVADAIMGRRGFGMVINGLLIDAGLAGAYLVLKNRFGGLDVLSPLTIAGVAFFSATALLLICGLAKNAFLR